MLDSDEAMYRLGVDIGGTFTDFALLEAASGDIRVHKRLTTPADPSIAVLAGIESLAREHGVTPSDIATLVHGTTLITNAVIERRGAATGLLTTEGFRDLLTIGKEQRYDMWDLRLRFPEPIVPRPRRREVRERILHTGVVEAVLDIEGAVAAAEELVRDEGIETLAICFLHAYVNPTHEKAVAEAIAARFPDLYLSLSSEVSPFMWEFERFTTTTVNAYTQPLADRYLGGLESGLAKLGFQGDFRLMTSSGGATSPATARRFPVRLIESGPAAGALMCAFLGRQLDQADLLSFDMGGTTTKGALILGHRPMRQDSLEVARIHGFKKGSGLPLKIPVIDMIEIGSGGGGIAGIDQRGLIRVGPESAGAEPGPACYGRGGEEATLTDANLTLGYLDPDFFLGGEMSLDAGAAEAAIDARLATPLGLAEARAGWGVHETVNEDVVRAFRVHAAERGVDHRRCAMVAFGGSGPVHAARIARKLKIDRVIYPAGAGVMSAIGLLASPISYEIIRSDKTTLDDLDGPAFAAKFAALAGEASAFLDEAGIAADAVRLDRRLDMRYRGQGYEVEVVLPVDQAAEATLADLPRLFEDAYEAVFAMRGLRHGLEIVNWKIAASGPAPTIGERGYRLVVAGTGQGTPARKGVRRTYFPETGYLDCPVYDRYSLQTGATLSGPALVEERESTCLIGPGDRLVVDDMGNLIAEIAGDEE